MDKILVTGASGFIGSAIGAALTRDGLTWRAAYRSSSPPGVDAAVVGDLGPDTDWSAALQGVGVVVHTAGPAHASHSEAEFQRAHAEGARRLAEQAEVAGVRRFVLVSSAKAGGDRTTGAPLTETSAARPETPYGRAKLAGERAVLERAGLTTIVLRPPLVHAAGAKGNVRSLLVMADTPLPLPLGGLSNRRSIIARDALVEAILAVIRAPTPRPGVYYVADRSSCSTSEMATWLREGMGRAPHLLPSQLMLGLAPRVLTESFEVDDAAFRAAYGYGRCADLDTREQLVRTGRAWKARA